MARKETDDARRARLAAEVAAEDLKALERMAELSAQVRAGMAEMEALAGQLIHPEAAVRLALFRSGQTSATLGSILNSVDQGVAAMTASTQARLKGEG